MKRGGPLRRKTALTRGTSLLRRRQSEIPRRGTFRSRLLLEAVRLMPCAFCSKRPPVSAHHFPPKSILAFTDDRLACPACGDGVRGCHGRAQRREIAVEAQLDAVAEAMLSHILAGRMTLEQAFEAVARVPRLDWRERLARRLSPRN